jgi:hypothetical protein
MRVSFPLDCYIPAFGGAKITETPSGIIFLSLIMKNVVFFVKIVKFMQYEPYGSYQRDMNGG